MKLTKVQNDNSGWSTRDKIWIIAFMVAMVLSCISGIALPVIFQEQRNKNEMFNQLRQMGFSDEDIDVMFNGEEPVEGFTIADVKEQPKFKQYNVGDIINIPFGAKIGDVIELEPYVDLTTSSYVIRDNLFNEGDVSNEDN